MLTLLTMSSLLNDEFYRSNNTGPRHFRPFDKICHYFPVKFLWDSVDNTAHLLAFFVVPWVILL